MPGPKSCGDNAYFICLQHAAVIEGGRAAIKEILFRHRMKLAARLKSWLSRSEKPTHLQHGELGERAAKRYLKRQGLKFLTANFRSPRGEIDLVFRDGDCLVFVEVKTRSSEDWARPAAAVNAERRRRLTRTALDYLRLLRNPPVKLRFDIVEVLLLDGAVREVRHLPNTFPMERPYRYG
jgi:putative endonuclease